MALKCDCLGTTKYLVVPRCTPSALWVAFSPHNVFLIDAASAEPLLVRTGRIVAVVDLLVEEA